jgi:uncharacterized membrane protein
MDWLALILFFAAWMGYAWFAGRGHEDGTTLLHRTNLYRRYWLMQATFRDPRMLDGLITQNLSATPAFFSSTTIIIIGGLLAVMGASEQVSVLVEGIPFVRGTSVEVFDLKLLLVVGIYVYAFFRFSWSMRLYTFVALAIGAMPPPADFETGKFNLEKQRLTCVLHELRRDGLGLFGHRLYDRHGVGHFHLVSTGVSLRRVECLDELIFCIYRLLNRPHDDHAPFYPFALTHRIFGG